MPKIGMRVWLSILCFFLSTISSALADGECGDRNNGSLCAYGMCCSHYGYCGVTAAYRCGGCQSQCDASVCAPPPPPPPVPPSPPPRPPVPTPPPPEGGGIANLITKRMFDYFLKYKDDPRCHAVGFYTYEAFIDAANFFPEFGNTGNNDTCKREIAAFLGQTSHETTGWSDAPDGPQFWGYCYKKEINKLVLCDYPTIECPCASGKMYYGRGPMQLSHNYNYCKAGKSPAINYNLLNDPDKVAEDVLMSFKTALWFWMTEQPPKPSCHNVIVGSWVPTPADIDANRLPGYEVITNIINGGLECGHGYDSRVDDRIKFYERYCDEFGIEYGDNLDCYNQRPYGGSGESFMYTSM